MNAISIKHKGPKGHISCTAILSQSEAEVAILFSDQLEKHKLCREHYILASCQVALNSVQRFQRSKNVSANQRPGQPSGLSNWPKNKNFVEDFEILLPVKFR